MRTTETIMAGDVAVSCACVYRNADSIHVTAAVAGEAVFAFSKHPLGGSWICMHTMVKTMYPEEIENEMRLFEICIDLFGAIDGRRVCECVLGYLSKTEKEIVRSIGV